MSIVAVVVSYNPPDDMAQRVAAVLAQVNHLVIVDNGSDTLSIAVLKAIEAQHASVTMLWNKHNKGLAAALNQGIGEALKRQADWVLLLDHDSTPDAQMVGQLLTGYEGYGEKERIGLLAPDIRDENSKAPTRYLLPRGAWCFTRAYLDEATNDKALVVITSGSLVKASLFNIIGLMPEHFFIDYLDYAFCLALKKAGYRILLVKDAVLHHRLGEKIDHSIAGIKVTASNHSARRRYTIFRNRIWLWKRYGGTFPGFVAHDVLAAVYDVFRVVGFERHKWEKYKAVLKGCVAGFGQEKQ